jgi:predicted DsbA family dithiol-disulfide isomerase
MRDRFGAEITWLPFELHPEYPPEGISRAELHARYGESMRDRLKAQFEKQGARVQPAARRRP